MNSKRILVVGMVDSVHLARWMNQFKASNDCFLILPSSHFRRVHKQLTELESENIHILGSKTAGKYLGYIDYFITLTWLSPKASQKVRSFGFFFISLLFRPNIVHAIEIQHAGYITAPYAGRARKRILTNWGSDIYYFQHFPKHQKKIVSSLQWATHYSAECSRDYSLAQSLGYNGKKLPKIPNAGGFDTHGLNRPADTRKQLIVKGYGGEFGLGTMAIRVSREFLTANSDSTVMMYSVTEDLVAEAFELRMEFFERFKFITIDNPISHEQLMQEFERSAIYLGLSRSDGLSTSFLQALTTGAYPIQSNTSCASEFLELGAIGSVIEPNFEETVSVLQRIYEDVGLRNKAGHVNLNVSKKHLDYSQIALVAATFYAEIS